jgi:hypothetical protein
VCAVVGVLFFALAPLLEDRLLVPLGASVTAVALVALVAGLATGVAPSTVTGGGRARCSPGSLWLPWQRHQGQREANEGGRVLQEHRRGRGVRGGDEVFAEVEAAGGGLRAQLSAGRAPRQPSRAAETSSTATPTGTLVTGSGGRRVWTPSSTANSPPMTKMPTAAISDQV